MVALHRLSPFPVIMPRAPLLLWWYQGLVCGAIGAASVLLTDYTLLENVRANIEMNKDIVGDNGTPRVIRCVCVLSLSAHGGLTSHSPPFWLPL